MIASLPVHKYVYVDSSYIRANGTGWEPSVWFGLVSMYARALGLNVLLECGAIYRSLPPHAVAFRKDQSRGQSQTHKCGIATATFNSTNMPTYVRPV